MIAQPGVFAEGTRDHYHLEFDLREGVGPSEVLDAVRRLDEPAVTSGGANIVVGFGRSLMSRLPIEQPAGFAEYPRLASLPQTPHDIWVWVHGTGIDVVLDVARAGFTISRDSTNSPSLSKKA